MRAAFALVIVIAGVGIAHASGTVGSTPSLGTRGGGGGGGVDPPGLWLPVDAQSTIVQGRNYGGLLVREGATLDSSTLITDMSPGSLYAGGSDLNTHVEVGALWIDDMSCWIDGCYTSSGLAMLTQSGPTTGSTIHGRPLAGGSRLALNPISTSNWSFITAAGQGLSIGGPSTDASQRWLTLTSSAITPHLAIHAPSSSTAVYSFADDTDTGMFRYFADQIGFSAAGATVARITTSEFVLHGGASTFARLSGDVRLASNGGNGSVVLAPNGTGRVRLDQAGTAASPALAFSADIDTGIYGAAIDTLGIATGGVARIDIGTTSMRPATDGAYALGTGVRAWSGVTALGFHGRPDSTALVVQDDQGVMLTSTGDPALQVTSTSDVRMLTRSSGTTAIMQLPNVVAVTVTLPTCNDSNKGAMAYIDRIGDNQASAVCICGSTSTTTPTYAWHAMWGAEEVCD